MAKLALLIGVSDYEPGLTALPSARQDVIAVQQVLEHPEIGGFTVKTLLDPDRQSMEEAIEQLFADRNREDLVMLFFSGHGIKNDRGRLYFATRNTRKTEKGELAIATAVSASFVHEVMGNSRAKRQIIVLDCCFSGAFAENMPAKAPQVENISTDIRAQLGAEGRAVLTSSTATQYSFEQTIQKESQLSVYTSYLVEGLKSGAADLDRNGVISVDELHNYTRGRVREVAPAMKPEIYAVREGYKIQIARVAISDPELLYRRQVQDLIRKNQGKLSDFTRQILDAERLKLRLTFTIARNVEAEVLQAFEEQQNKIKKTKQSQATITQAFDFRGQKWQCKLTILNSNVVHSIAISSNGKMIISGDEDGKVKVWNLTTGELVRICDSCSSSIYSVAISSNGKMIVSGDEDGKVKIWNLTTGELVRTFTGHSGSIHSVAVSSDSQIIATGSRDTTVRLWDMNGNLIHILAGHSNWIRALAISSDNRFVVSGGDDTKVKIWDLTSGTSSFALEDHTRWIRSVTISSDNQILVSAGDDLTIKVWNLVEGRLLRNITEFITDQIYSVAISSDKSVLVAGGRDKNIKIWPLSTFEVPHVLSEHTDYINSIAISSSGQEIVSGSSDRTIKIWQVIS